MNFYVYPEDDVKYAFDELRYRLDRNKKQYEFTERFCETEDVSYHFYSLTMGDCYFLYPSASLWNRKVHELLFKSMFPDINPIEADYFLVPVTIHYGTPYTPRAQQLAFEEWISHFYQSLSYWQYHKNKHVFFVAGDSWRKVEVLDNTHVFRTSCAKKSEDYVVYYDVIIDIPDLLPITSCDFECSFIGCLETHPLRRGLPLAIDKVVGKKSFESTPNFFTNLPEKSRQCMELKWVEVLNNSKFIMAPRGGGLNSIRFFEALAFGRIPVLIADDTKLPLEKVIDYSKFIVRVPESKMQSSNVFIKDFLERNDLEEASKLARSAWNTYFSGGKLRKCLELSLPAPINENGICKYKMM